jgi:hypothetical protein
MTIDQDCPRGATLNGGIEEIDKKKKVNKGWRREKSQDGDELTNDKQASTS